MKILVIDQDGVGLSFCWRCAMAGHTVRWFIKPRPSNNQDTGRGFKGIEKITNWVSSAMWADLVFSTSNDDYIERLDFFKMKGVKVFAPPKETVNLEVNRAAGMKMLEKAGIECAPYITVKNIDEAIATVKKKEERYVLKTLGSNEDKSLTYCSKSPADMVETLLRWKAEGINPKGDLMLQTFITGIEVGISRWMGSEGWVGQWNVSHEFKKLMPGNFGCNTGEMGTIAYFTKNEKLGTDTLGKLEKDLLKMKHLGDTALGFIIDEKGQPWPTEWTTRPGWPVFNMMLGAIEGDPAQWMLDALNGKDTTSFKEDIGACVVMAHKDFPYSNATKKEQSDYPIYGVTKGAKRHIHPQSVKIDVRHDMDGGKIVERPVWSTSGDYVLVVTGYGKDVKQACTRAYKTVGALSISNVIVRDDIGEKLEKELPELHKLGYCLSAEYQT